jgi:hypothetical protein
VDRGGFLRIDPPFNHARPTLWIDRSGDTTTHRPSLCFFALARSVDDVLLLSPLAFSFLTTESQHT